MFKEYTREEGIAAIKTLHVVTGQVIDDADAGKAWDKASPAMRMTIMVMLQIKNNNPVIGEHVADLEMFTKHPQDITAIWRAMGLLKIPHGSLPLTTDGQQPAMILDVMGDKVLLAEIEMGPRTVRSLKEMVEGMRVNPLHCNRALNLFDEACIHDDCLELLEGRDCIARGLKPKQMCPSCLDYWHRTMEIAANKSQEVAP